MLLAQIIAVSSASSFDVIRVARADLPWKDLLLSLLVAAELYGRVPSVVGHRSK